MIHEKDALHWRHNGCDSVSNHQPRDCLLNRLSRHRLKKTSKLRVTGLCAGNSPGTGELPAQMASNAENVSIWWRHHGIGRTDRQIVKTMMTSSYGKIVRVTCPLRGEFTGHQWIPLTKASDAEPWCFLWFAPWKNGWVNNGEAYYGVVVMSILIRFFHQTQYLHV